MLRYLIKKLILCVNMRAYWPWWLAVLISTYRVNLYYLHFKYLLLGSLLYHPNVPHPLVNIHWCVFGMKSDGGLSVIKWMDVTRP
jgi:hypothetical protein